MCSWCAIGFMVLIRYRCWQLLILFVKAPMLCRASSSILSLTLSLDMVGPLSSRVSTMNHSLQRVSDRLLRLWQPSYISFFWGSSTVRAFCSEDWAVFCLSVHSLQLIRSIERSWRMVQTLSWKYSILGLQTV
jgi:hypothetical protein